MALEPRCEGACHMGLAGDMGEAEQHTRREARPRGRAVCPCHVTAPPRGLRALLLPGASDAEPSHRRGLLRPPQGSTRLCTHATTGWLAS